MRMSQSANVDDDYLYGDSMKIYDVHVRPDHQGDDLMSSRVRGLAGSTGPLRMEILGASSNGSSDSHTSTYSIIRIRDCKHTQHLIMFRRP